MSTFRVENHIFKAKVIGILIVLHLFAALHYRFSNSDKFNHSLLMIRLQCTSRMKCEMIVTGTFNGRKYSERISVGFANGKFIINNIQITSEPLNFQLFFLLKIVQNKPTINSFFHKQ